VTWDLDDDSPGKAYEPDEHPIGDCWQLVDFMAKLGLVYPVDYRRQAIGETYTFSVNTGD
jgi:hypothetical protein